MNPIQTELPVLNVEQDRLARRERALRIVMPTLAIIIALGIWEGLVRYYQVPHYLIPAPSLVAQTLIKDGPSLMASMWFTVKLTLISLGCAIIGGILLGMIFALSRPIEMAFFPFAVILQVTPVIAIAPLILIYVRDTFSALLICAWIVAFFPILSNTVIDCAAPTTTCAIFSGSTVPRHGSACAICWRQAHCLISWPR